MTSPAPGTVPGRGETAYMLSKRKADARKMDTLECPVTPPNWRRETEAAGVSRFTKTECGKDSSYQAGADSREQRVANLSAQTCPPLTAHRLTPSALTHKAVLHAGEE